MNNYQSEKVNEVSAHNLLHILHPVFDSSLTERNER